MFSGRNYQNSCFVNLESILFDIMSLKNADKMQYTNPALTKTCVHFKCCFEMQEALQVIEDNQVYYCPYCGQCAKSPNDLVQDWRVKAYEEFNEDVDYVTIIKGIMVNQYKRNKTKYLDFFIQEEYQYQLLSMFDRTCYDFSIYTLIQRDYKQQNLNKNSKIYFWCFCLLDKVKINIPVRILGCKHYECYELTSLLYFQQQNRKKIKYLYCNHPGCQNRLKIADKDYSKQTETSSFQKTDEQERITDIQILFYQIGVDYDLFKVINKSHPSSLKFYYNYDTNQIQEDINIVDGKFVDPLILKFYEEHYDLQNKMQYQEFQNLFQNYAMLISQGDLRQQDKQIAKLMALQKYRNYEVKMIDLFTQLPIEYPVRCKFCTDLQVCMDMRSYIADFIYQKKMNPTQKYACPLCKNQQNGQILKVYLQNYIYLDSNMLSYMFKDVSYTKKPNIFQYQGEQYLLQQIMDRQNIKRETYIENLQDRYVVFKQLYCAINPQQKIKQPLILEKCPKKNIFDFKSFYEELKRINFDLEDQGVILCRCDYCVLFPIHSLENIYFYEAFYEDFNKFYKKDNTSNETSFSYKFADREEESILVDIKMAQNPLQQQKITRSNIAQSMKQNIGGVQIDQQRDSVHVKIQEAVEQFNQNTNQDLKDNVIDTVVQLNNLFFKLNEGEFNQRKY